jgi:NADH-quinone oxidoreductase subunit L
MRNYGNLRRKLPYTFWAMMIGTLAITGVGIPLTTIGFAGFLSKDAIIESAWGAHTTWGNYGFWLLVVAAAMTSFYSWRLMFMTFFGEARGDAHTHEHAHESPWTMLAPLGVLALGSIFAGMIWFGSFFGSEEDVNEFYGMPVHAEASETSSHDTAEGAGEAATEASEDGTEGVEAGAEVADHAAGEGGEIPGWREGDGALWPPVNEVMDRAHHAPKWVKASPFIAMLLGLALAFQMYIRRPDWPAKLAANQQPLYLFLLNKWYFDEIFDAVFTRPMKRLGGILWRRGDGSVIDGGLNGLAMGIIPFFTRLAGRAQSGYVFHYALAMVIGIVVLITWMTIGGGAN